MSKLEPHEDRLQSYLDGELDSTRRAELESELSEDAALRAELLRIERLRALFLAAPAGLAAPDPGELAFERVRNSIHSALAPAPTAPTAPTVSAAPSAGATVIPLRSRTAKPGAPLRRWAVGGIVGGLVAAAAAITIVATRAPSGSGTPQVASHDPGTRTPPRTPRANRLNGTEIVRVEFGKMSGTYWEQSEGDDRVAVVWIDDTVLEEVGRQ